MGGNVPRNSILLKLGFSDWISAHGHAKSGVIVYLGGVLTQILQHSMVDSNVISFSASDFLQNCSEEADPITENSVTNVWCNLITTYRSCLSWCGKAVANNSMAVCNQNLNCIKVPLVCGEWQINIFTKMLVSSAYILKSCAL